MATDGWIVTGQQSDVPVNTSAGQTIVGVQVYFTTADGNQSSVFVPNSQYSEAKVRSLIEEQANLLDSVGRMASGNLSKSG